MEDEKALTEEIVALASQFGRYGYRRITALLRHRGWRVNHKRVLTECYRRTYNRVRPHNSLGYRPPAPEALLPADPVPVLAGLT